MIDDEVHTDLRLCEDCGYDLRATGDGRCPECGRPFDPGVAARPRMPWVRRRETGRAAAFVRTVGTVMFRTGRAAEDYYRHLAIDPRDARSFRLTCVAAAALAVGVVSAVSPLYRGKFDGLSELGMLGGAVATLLVVTPAAFGLLFGATDALSVPGRRYLEPAVHARAVALYDYVAAALACSPLPVALFGLAVASARVPALAPLQRLLWGSALAGFGLLTALWLVNALWVLRRSTACGPAVLPIMAGKLIFNWLICWGMAVGGGGVVGMLIFGAMKSD